MNRILKKMAYFRQVKGEKEDESTLWMCDYESYFKKQSQTE
jgi:hypothetical protein